MTGVTRLAGTPNAVTTSFTYEPTFNQLASVTDPLQNTTTYSYDTSGNLITVSDPMNHQTTFAYNGAGQATSITDAMQDTAQFSYNSGDLTGITDPAGQTTTRLLDPPDSSIRYQSAWPENTVSVRRTGPVAAGFRCASRSYHVRLRPQRQSTRRNRRER